MTQRIGFGYQPLNPNKCPSRAPFQRIDLHIHFARVVPQRMGLGTPDAGGPDQRLVEFERTRRAGSDTADGGRARDRADASRLGVEDVALDEEVLERARRGRASRCPPSAGSGCARSPASVPRGSSRCEVKSMSGIGSLRREEVDLRSESTAACTPRARRRRRSSSTRRG